MFVILAYDINKKRVGKIHKICRKYLRPIQKSIFEGDIAQRHLKKLMDELDRNIVKKEDTICIYELDSSKYTYKVQIGAKEEFSNVL